MISDNYKYIYPDVIIVFCLGISNVVNNVVKMWGGGPNRAELTLHD